MTSRSRWILVVVALAGIAAVVGTCVIGGGRTPDVAPRVALGTTSAERPRTERGRASVADAANGSSATEDAASRPARADDPAKETTTVRVSVVTESDGAPIENAAVRVWSRSPEFDARVRTGADGTCAVERVPVRGREVIVDVTAEGFVGNGEAADAHAVADAAGGHLPFVIRLAEGGTVEGRVVGPDGNPAPKVRVQLQDGRGYRIAETHADATGRFVLTGVRLRVAYVVTCDSDAAALPEHLHDGQPVLCPPDEPVPVDLTRASRTAQVVLTMRACGTVVAQVVWADGSPVPVASVELVSSESRLSARVEGGTHRFLLEPGTYRVSASATGSVAETVPVTVGAGATEQVTLRLTAGAALDGVVVDARGTPLTDVTMVVTWRDPGDRYGRWQDAGDARTDVHGHFRIAGMRTGIHEIAANRDDLPRVVLRQSVPVAALRIVVPDWARIRFRVTVPQGIAAPDRLEVSLLIPDLDGDSTGMWSTEATRTGDVWEVRAAPDVTSVGIGREGFLGARFDVRLQPGAITDVGTIEIDPGIAFRGRVVDESGHAIAAASVDAWDAVGSGGGGHAQTSPDGAFALEHLGHDIAWLEVSVAGHVTTHVAVEAPRDGLTIAVPRGVVVTGTVVDAAGAPVPSAWVSAARVAVTSEGGLGGWTFTDAAGGFSTRVVVGRAHLVARTKAGARGAADVDVSTTGATGVMIRLDR